MSTRANQRGAAFLRFAGQSCPLVDSRGQPWTPFEWLVMKGSAVRVRSSALKTGFQPRAVGFAVRKCGGLTPGEQPKGSGNARVNNGRSPLVLVHARPSRVRNGVHRRHSPTASVQVDHGAGSPLFQLLCAIRGSWTMTMHDLPTRAPTDFAIRMTYSASIQDEPVAPGYHLGDITAQ